MEIIITLKVWYGHALETIFMYRHRIDMFLRPKVFKFNVCSDERSQ